MTTIISVLLYFFLFLAVYVQVFLLVTFFESRERFMSRASRKPAPRGSDADVPRVSIIVPCWNEECTLKGTVDSLLALEYPKEKLQIIVVDDGSTDGTALAASAFAGHSQITLLSKKNGGKHTALNEGLVYAEKSDIVGCLDADSFVSPDALYEMLPYFDDPSVMAVTPFIRVHTAHNVIERIQVVEYVVSGLWRKLLSSLNAQYVTPGPFSLYRRSVFTELGLYRPAHQTEDLEIAMRMQAAHMRIESAHTAVVYTSVPRTLPALIRQRVRWYSGFLRNAFDYRRLLLNPRYGHVAMFSMPGGFIAIVSAVTLFLSGLFNALLWLRTEILQIVTIGFRFPAAPSFDWFFFDTGMYRLLTLTTFLLFIVTVFCSGLLIRERGHFAVNTIFYFLLYGLMAPLWCMRTLFNIVTVRQGKWR